MPIPEPNNTEQTANTLKLPLLFTSIDTAYWHAKNAGIKESKVIVGLYLMLVHKEKANIPIKCMLQMPAEKTAAAVTVAKR